MKSQTNPNNIIYIGLGANLNDPQTQLLMALESIKKLPQTKLLQVSSFYLSKPMGPQDQGDYINAVAKIQSQLLPLELLDALQAIEKNQGRIRKTERWGARTLDLDILLFNNETIDSTRLTVPHYGMKQRNFVILPLYEISPDLILPDTSQLSELVEKTDKQGIQKL